MNRNKTRNLGYTDSLRGLNVVLTARGSRRSNRSYFLLASYFVDDGWTRRSASSRVPPNATRAPFPRR